MSAVVVGFVELTPTYFAHKLPFLRVCLHMAQVMTLLKRFFTALLAFVVTFVIVARFMPYVATCVDKLFRAHLTLVHPFATVLHHVDFVVVPIANGLTNFTVDRIVVFVHHPHVVLEIDLRAKR